MSAASSRLLASSNLVLGDNVPARRHSLGDSHPQGPTVSSRMADLSPSARTMETVGLAPEGHQLIDSGLITEVVETILNARAPSTRKLYALKWRLFVLWCEEGQLDPVNCAISIVLEFLQDRFSAGLAPSTIRVYVAAISASHAPVNGASVGQHPLTSRFMRGVRRLRPICRLRVPSWDLSVVLEGLSAI